MKTQKISFIPEKDVYFLYGYLLNQNKGSRQFYFLQTLPNYPIGSKVFESYNRCVIAFNLDGKWDISFCSNKDQFNKNKGKLTAQNRLLNNKNTHIYYWLENESEYFLNYIQEEIDSRIKRIKKLP